MVSKIKDFLDSFIEVEKFEEVNQETSEQWKRDFLSVVEQGNNIEDLQQCLSTLDSCSSRFIVGDENAETNRGNFILQTLHNSHEQCVRDFLTSQEEEANTIASLKLQGYFTPCFLRDVRAVRCVVQNHCKFGKPRKFSKEGREADDDLDEALTSLNCYVALTDPIYISACFLEDAENSLDPVRRSFQLNRELLAVAEKEYEFKNEYNTLRERCKDFAVEVLEECRNMEPEIRCVLESGSESKQNEPLDILHLAVLNDNKQFVSHPYSQLLLNAEIYKGVSYLKKTSNSTFLGVMLLITILLPILLPALTLFHVFYPRHKVSMMVSSPLMKFLTYVSSYAVFVILLVKNILAPFGEFLQLTVVGWLTIAWFIGLTVDITIELFDQTKTVRQKLSTSWLKSFGHVFATGWNAVAAAFIPVTITALLVGNYGQQSLTEQEVEFLKARKSPEESHAYSMMLISFGFYGLAYLLAFIYTASFLALNSYTGPLLHAMVEMVKEVLKFFGFFSVIFFAFSFSFKKLYLQYSYTATSGSAHTTLPGTMYVTFWSLFGEVDNEEFKTGDGYEVIELGGLTLFGVYNVVAVLVMLNMLIAILNDAYIKITEDLDKDWKFTRSAIWMNWIHKKEAIPPPFNIISILLKLVKRLFQKCTCVSSRSVKRKKIPTEKRREVLQRLVQKYLERERKTKH